MRIKCEMLFTKRFEQHSVQTLTITATVDGDELWKIKRLAQGSSRKMLEQWDWCFP